MRDIKAGLDSKKNAYPNFVDMAAHEVFRSRNPKSVADPIPTRAWTKATRERIALMNNRKNLRIGIPRVLNQYVYAPLLNGYLESLGIPAENIVYSDYTSGELYRAGSSRGAIDPCFPAKIGIAHVHNLIAIKGARKQFNVIFFPMFDVLTSPLLNIIGSNACPTVTATPETVKAAYTKENDVFADHGITYLDPIVNLGDRKLFEQQMFEAWKSILGLSQEENGRAVEAGYRAQEEYETSIQKRSREVLDQLEREDRIGIVMLGRPYHHDPGLNHEILEEFQKLGYPIFSQSTLPLDEDLLDRLFGEEVRAGVIKSPLEIQDAWKQLLLVQHQPQGLGGEVHGAASESGGARNVELQMRARCADLRSDRRHHRRNPARRTSASRTSTRTSRRARSGFALRPSITSCGVIART